MLYLARELVVFTFHAVGISVTSTAPKEARPDYPTSTSSKQPMYFQHQSVHLVLHVEQGVRPKTVRRQYELALQCPSMACDKQII
jgi:hypothetical protein